MATFPLIRSLERQEIDHLLIVTSEMNKTVFQDLRLRNTQLTIETMRFQDSATYAEIKQLAKKIRSSHGQPDLCIEAMRKKNIKTLLFIKELHAKCNFQVVDLQMKCFSPVCQIASRMDQKFRAPVPMTWSILMREAGFPCVRGQFELPISPSVLSDVRMETRRLNNYIAFNFEGSISERSFSYDLAKKIITTIQLYTDMPIMIVHSPKIQSQVDELLRAFDNVYHLSLAPSIQRSAAVIHDAFLAITPDTSIMHMASAYNTPVLSIYSNYKTRWANMQDIAETIVVGAPIDHINLNEFTQRFTSLLMRLQVNVTDPNVVERH